MKNSVATESGSTNMRDAETRCKPSVARITRLAPACGRLPVRPMTGSCLCPSPSSFADAAAAQSTQLDRSCMHSRLDYCSSLPSRRPCLFFCFHADRPWRQATMVRDNGSRVENTRPQSGAGIKSFSSATRSCDPGRTTEVHESIRIDSSGVGQKVLRLTAGAFRAARLVLLLTPFESLQLRG